MVANRIRSIRKFLKRKDSVSQVLSAVLMIFMLITAIGVVYSWLFPMFGRFQTTNTINSAVAYMLRFDNGIYNLANEGEGSIKSISLDPFEGQYTLRSGKNMSLRFSDEAGLYNESFGMETLGSFQYRLFGQRGAIVDTGSYKYLVGPSIQQLYFINDTNGDYYSGLTNMTLFRPTASSMRVELDYRISIYSWFDQANEVLSISVSVFVLESGNEQLTINSYRNLNILNNRTEELYSATTTSSTDFYVDGTLSPTTFDPFERTMTFQKPGTVGTYTIQMSVFATYFTLWNT